MAHAMQRSTWLSRRNRGPSGHPQITQLDLAAPVRPWGNDVQTGEERGDFRSGPEPHRGPTRPARARSPVAGPPNTTPARRQPQKNGRFSGSTSFQLAIGNFSGNVQFVNVSGSEGCLSGEVTSSTIAGIDPGQGYTVQVQNNTPSAPDLLGLQFGTPSNSCSITGIVSPAAVTSGDITITTNARP